MSFIDPLIVLLGGPGAHALDRLSDTTKHLAQVLSARDVILFDPFSIEASPGCPGRLLSGFYPFSASKPR